MPSSMFRSTRELLTVSHVPIARSSAGSKPYFAPSVSRTPSSTAGISSGRVGLTTRTLSRSWPNWVLNVVIGITP